MAKLSKFIGFAHGIAKNIYECDYFPTDFRILTAVKSCWRWAKAPNLFAVMSRYARKVVANPLKELDSLESDSEK